jgi:hypothetical protein
MMEPLDDLTALAHQSKPMKNCILICLSLFVTVAISGCLKKGEDDPNVQSTNTGNDINSVYDIKELRHKKMVWHYHRTFKDANGFFDSESEIVLESTAD